MAWALPYLYLQLIFHVRDATEVAGVTLEIFLAFSAGCIALFLIGLGVHRFVLSLHGARGKVNWRFPFALLSHKP
jgi:hypothetical protein